MDKKLEKQWQKIWKASNGSTYQSIGWIKSRESAGQKPIFTLIEENGIISGGIVAFEKTKNFPFLGKKKILLAEGSPIVLDKSVSVRVLKMFKKTSRDYAYGECYANVISPEENEFIKGGFHKTTSHTSMLDLSLSESALFSNMEKKSIRWGVNYAKRNGLSFTEPMEPNEINSFYELYKKTAEEGRFQPEKKEFLKKLIEEGTGKLFLIKLKNKILGGGLILLDVNKEYSILNLTSCTEKGLKLQTMPFLYWNLILYSKSSGMKYFDFGGYDVDARKGDKLYNINKFKERFGGKITPQLIFSTSLFYASLRNLSKKSKLLRRIYEKTKSR
ncbi:hypothetical protein COU60_00890 [Candidatus Pacearchaeota archaeon CG10_big_fil_rev_8_21_14_0_10_34_76]|nr:MAG: hypothetical protein COU60_00890 [Candidatus Pacearchaeota archaeon CG10_big_fil_rev_8_21_14_0_10_34_76]